MRRSYLVLLAVISLFFLPALGISQEPGTPITWTRHSIKSTTLDEQRTYYIVLPSTYSEPGRARHRYPVLVTLDVQHHPLFVSTIANTQFLASSGHMPEVIIVGVVTEDTTIPHAQAMIARQNDLSPQPNANWANRFPKAGRADAVVRFLTDELLPVVRTNYRTLPATYFAGHSSAGDFALHVAATAPGAFQGIIASDPSLDWNDGELVEPYAQMLAKQTVPSRLFITNTPGSHREIERLLARTDTLKHPTVAIERRQYEYDHATIPVPSYLEGLRFIFRPVALAPIAMFPPSQRDSAWIVTRAGEVSRQYAERAAALRLPVQLPEIILNNWGYQALRLLPQQPGVAVALFRKNVTLHPDSPNANDSLGDALLAAGDTAGARTQFEKAVALARTSQHPILRESERKLAKLKQPN